MDKRKAPSTSTPWRALAAIPLFLCSGAMLLIGVAAPLTPTFGRPRLQDIVAFFVIPVVMGFGTVQLASGSTRQVMRICIGVVATLVALVLALRH